MKFLFATLLLVTFANGAGAVAGASDFSVKGLYEKKSWLPNFYLPFRISAAGVPVGEIAIGEVAVESDSTAADCRALRDPHYATIIILRCRAEAFVYLNFSASHGNKVEAIHFGPIAVSNPGGLAQLAPPTAVPADTPMNIAAGRTLFQQKCVGCHQAKGSGGELDSATITSAKIKQAFAELVKDKLDKNQIPAMPAYVLDIPETDIQKIADYLESL